MVGVWGLLLLVGHFYIPPAAVALAEAAMGPEGAGDEHRRRTVAAYSSLLLILILLIISLILLGIHRGRRLFRSAPKPPHTEYPDAWAESARRVKVEDDE